VGPVRREHTRGGIRTPAGVTRRGRVRPGAAGPAPGVTPRRGAGGRAGRSQGAQAAGPARPDLSQAREAAQRQTRQDATRDQAELRGAGKAEIAAAGDARAGRQARAKQAEAELERTRAEHDQAAGGPPGITPRPATPPPALAGKLSDQHLLAQNIRSGVGVAWRLAASRRAHSALSAATSCCCHVEFRAGKRWCACQRGCALLPGSWAGEGIEYGGGVSSADPREYPCVCRSRALAGAVWPRPRRNGPGRRAWPWSQSLLIARASSMACSGLPGRAGLVIPQPPPRMGRRLADGQSGLAGSGGQDLRVGQAVSTCRGSSWAGRGRGMSNPLSSVQIVRYLPMRSAMSTSPCLPNACSALSYTLASTECSDVNRSV